MKPTENQMKTIVSTIANTGKACEVCGDRIKQKLDYNKFVEANSTFVGFSEGALRPLIHEQDPEIQQKVISLSENLGNLKDYPTFVGFKEFALHPLINEQNPEIKQKVISLVESAANLKDYPTFVGFSEFALRPLIREQDPEIKQKVITLVAKGGKRKKGIYGTEDLISKIREILK